MDESWQNLIIALCTIVTTAVIDIARRFAVKRIDIWEDELRREKDLEESDDDEEA